ncbi:MAG: S-layer homology domain-containing protein [Oscillospiraceae bacterium]|nr:S-layer homology domain-containing protein [Oscillospiraceae bacterium]
MKAISQKLTAMLMAVVMVFSLLSVSAFAAKETDSGSGEEASYSDSEVIIPESLAGGNYVSSVLVEPDDDEDFNSYYITVTVAVSDGAIAGLSVSGASGSNSQYSTKATEGVSEQLVGQTAGTVAVDAVSTATCSSKAIVKAVNAALQSESTGDTAITFGDAIYDADGTTFTLTVTDPADGVDYSAVSIEYGLGKFAGSLTVGTDFTVEELSSSEAEIVYEITILPEGYYLQEDDMGDLEVYYNAVGRNLNVTVANTTTGVTIESDTATALVNNQLFISGSDDVSLASYISAICHVTLTYTDESGVEQTAFDGDTQAAHDVYPDYEPADIFNEDGTVNFDCAIFTLGDDVVYTMDITAGTGYADVTGTVGDVAGETVYVTMNVPYGDFYGSEGVGEYFDAISTATTSKYAGTTGLAKGTYNTTDEDGNGVILGVTFPVAMTQETCAALLALNAGLDEHTDYYISDVSSSAPAAYKALTYADGTYTFGETVTVEQDSTGLSVGGLTTSGGYGDYQIDLVGVLTEGGVAIGDVDDITIYGVVLTDSEGNTYGMAMLENTWLGTRITNVEVAWSVPEGQQLRKGHNSASAPLYNQFDLNGATLTNVELITSNGTYNIACNVELPEYYSGDESLSAQIVTSTQMKISVPSALEDIEVSVSYKSGRSTVYVADGEEIVDGYVTLEGLPTSSTSYTVTVTSSNYAPMTATVTYGTAVSGYVTMLQASKLTYLEEVASAALEADSTLSNVAEHLAEVQEMVAGIGTDAMATSDEANTLIGELEEHLEADAGVTVDYCVFEDVEMDAYYYDAATWAGLEGISVGTSTAESIFSAASGCTRAQIILLLYNISGATEEDITITETPFTDVSEDAWYYTALLWAYENEVTFGTTTTTFSPDSDCTRAQIMAMLYRYAGSPEVETDSVNYTDVSASDYYYEAVLWAVENYVTYGTSATTYTPNRTCQRAEAISFLYRFMSGEWEATYMD